MAEEEMGIGVRKPKGPRLAGLPPSYAVAISAAMAMLLFGFDQGIIAGALLYVIPEFHLEKRPSLQGAIVSAGLAAALPGVMVSGPVCDWIGRRRLLLISALLFILGGAAMTAASGVETLITGRAVVGLAIGASAPAVPVFIAECSPAEVRGMLATLPQLCTSAGILLSYGVALIVSLQRSPSWRLMLGLSLVPAVIFGALMLSMPESPRWLLHKGRNDEAAAALARLGLSRDELKGNGRPAEQYRTDVDLDLVEGAAEGEEKGAAGSSSSSSSHSGPPLQDHPLAGPRGSLVGAPPTAQHPNLGETEEARVLLQDGQVDPRKVRDASRAQGGMLKGVRELARPGVRWALLVGAALQAFQQLVGINAVVFYTPQILNLAGSQKLIPLNAESAAIVATLVSYLLKVPAVLLSMRLVDLVGRRRLLLCSIPVMGSALLLLAVAFQYVEVGAGRAALAVLCIAAYGCSFVMALGPTPNILCSEMFETRIRGLAMGICVVVNFACSTAVTQTYPQIVETQGISFQFLAYAAVTFLAWLFIFYLLPETAGLSLEVTSHLLDSDSIQKQQKLRIGR